MHERQSMVLTGTDGNPLTDINAVTWDNALIAGPVDGAASQPLKDLWSTTQRLQSRSLMVL